MRQGAVPAEGFPLGHRTERSDSSDERGRTNASVEQRAGRLLLLSASVLLLTATLPEPSATASSFAGFGVTADAYVVTSKKTSNFGTLTSLQTQSAPASNIYLRFDPEGLTGVVTAATLRLFATVTTNIGVQVRSVADTTWTETGITSANAPPMGASVAATTAPLTAGSWVEADVTSLVKGNGLLSMALTTTDKTAAVFASRETGANAPQLVVATAPPDITSPAVPQGVSATATSARQVDVAWQATTDDVGVAGYTLYRTGVPLTTVGGAVTSYADTTVSPSTTYTYTIDAFDAAGNHSAQSDAASATTPAASSDPVIAAAGDIACDPASSYFNGGAGKPPYCDEQGTSDILAAGGFAGVLPLGDEAYECGGYTAFQQSYGPSWGRVNGITHPVPGNHEYLTASNSTGTGCSSKADAAGYYAYFGSAAGDPSKGWYSFDVGPWHLVALNGECAFVGGCGTGSPQEVWLKNDLAAHPSSCTLAYWHEPRFSSGLSGNHPSYGAFWVDLYNAHADVVLNGHDHVYERFAPQNPSQKGDPNGIREFIVGTGGKNHSSFGTVQPNSQVRNASAYGVLELTLHSGGYDWQFVPAAGASFSDSGTAPCV